MSAGARPHLVSLLRLGESAQHRADYRLARRCYEEVLEHVPGHEAAAFNLAAVLLRLGEPERAMELLRPLREHDSPDLRLAVEYNLADAEWRIAERTGDQATFDSALDRAHRVTVGASDGRRASTTRAVRSRMQGAAEALLAGMIVDDIGRRGTDVEPEPEPKPRFLQRLGRPRRRKQALAGEGWRTLATAKALEAHARSHYDQDGETRHNLARFAARAKVHDLQHVVSTSGHHDLEACKELSGPHADWVLDDPLLRPLRPDLPQAAEPVRPETAERAPDPRGHEAHVLEDDGTWPVPE